jgi:hypothetical protein
MNWTDQIPRTTVQQVVDAISADASLLPRAEADLNGFLVERMNIQPPTRLKLYQMPYGWFVGAESDPLESAFGYKFTSQTDDGTDELSDSELDLVSAGGGYGSCSEGRS